MVIPSFYPRREKKTEASNGPVTKPFELGVLQIILSDPPMSYSSRATRSAHTRWTKFWVLQKMGKKVSYFLKQKIAVIQAKSFCVKKNSKKSIFLILNI